MEHLLTIVSTFLDLLYSHIVGPLFSTVGQGLENALIRPLEILHLPVVLQVITIALLTGFLSIAIRRFMGVDEKDAVFREKFIRSRQSREDLQMISDWKSRETFARVIDDEIDCDFNTYLAGRFARHGLIYLLPIFLVLFWLENAMGASRLLFVLPDNRFGIQGIHIPLVFLLTYCMFLIIYFRWRKRKYRGKSALTISAKLAD